MLQQLSLELELDGTQSVGCWEGPPDKAAWWTPAVYTGPGRLGAVDSAATLVVMGQNPGLPGPRQPPELRREWGCRSRVPALGYSQVEREGVLGGSAALLASEVGPERPSPGGCPIQAEGRGREVVRGCLESRVGTEDEVI